MTCSCGAKIGSSSRYCPHCGQRAGEEFSEATTGLLREVSATTMLARELHESAGLATGAATGAATTVTIDPWSPPLPTKFRELLEAGMKPEVIIWDLFKHKTIMRNHLESLVADWPICKPSGQVESAVQYLHRHCVVCEKRVPTVALGTIPLCPDCDEQ